MSTKKYEISNYCQIRMENHQREIKGELYYTGEHGYVSHEEMPDVLYYKMVLK